MNSFMSWVGGKKNLRDEVLARFPPYYERYIEVFGGAGWVLFHKPPGTDFEVYNDLNGNVPFPVSWTVKMKKKQKETQDILSYHTQAAGCSDKARAKASGGRQPIEECGRTGL